MMLTATVLALSLAQGYPPYPPPYPPPPPPPRYYPGPPPAAAPRGLVGLVFMPLGSSTLSTDNQGPYQGSQTYASNWHGALALELRAPRGGGRIRFGSEFSEHDRILDVSLKYNFLDWGPIQPFVTLGAGAGRLGPETVWRATASLSAGVDLYLTRDFFFTAEVKGRGFSDLATYDPNNVYGSGVTMATVLFGAGVYF